MATADFVPDVGLLASFKPVYTLSSMVETQAVIKPMTPTQRVNFSEEVSKLLNFDYEKYDVPYIEE